MSKLFLVFLFVLVLVNSDIIQFDNNAIEKIFQNKQEKSSVLFLFTSDNEQSKKAKDAFQQFDQSKTSDDIILSNSDSEDGHGLFDRLAQYVGINPEITPRVLYLLEKKDKYLFEGQITSQNLKTFIEKVQAGQIAKTLKSDPIPELNNQPVKIGVGKNFKELVLDSQKQILVKFYAPWCGHCKNLAPHYDEAAKRLIVNPNIMLVKVDSTTNEVDGVQIEGFPTLKFYGKDKTQPPIDYNGARDSAGIINWLKEHTEYQWVELQQSQQTLEQL